MIGAMKMTFVGRKKELDSLAEHYETNQFQFAVIYGRQRIGKTALINEFIKDKHTNLVLDNYSTEWLSSAFIFALK